MPAVSEAQRRMMAIAEHHPDMLYKRNRGVLSMGKEKLHHYASTSEKNLPKRKKDSKVKHSMKIAAGRRS